MKNIKVSEKYVGLRVVLFIVALVLAVSAFSIGITSIGKKESGYQSVSTSGDIAFYYYFEGTSNSIKKELKALQTSYSAILSDYCDQLDSSITNLNSNLGSEISVPSQVYAVLKDAYARTLEKKNFNMFAGALYAEWESILILDDASEFDPLNNEYMAYRISEIAREVSDLSNFSLEFLDDDTCTVRFSVSEHYADFASEFELEAGALDLNLMSNAYKLSIITSELEALGYNNGYLITNDGLAVTLSETFEQSYVLYGIDEASTVIERGAFAVSGSSSKVFMSAFAFGSYYSATVNGRLRHLFFDTTTGEINDVLLACTIVSDEASNIVDDMANLIYVCSLKAEDEVTSALSSEYFVDCEFY